MVELTSLGSGSNGNSMLVTSGSTSLLIDAGFSAKEILKRLKIINANINIIKGILITHEHIDHIRGAKTLANGLDIPIYTTSIIYNSMEAINIIANKTIIISTNKSFNLGDFNDITAFEVPHDTQEAVGYIIQNKNIKISYMTDLGFIPYEIRPLIKDSDCIVIEANYDAHELAISNRPQWIKDRTLSCSGHLDNEYTFEFLSNLPCRVKHVVLAHISQKCNDLFSLKCLIEKTSYSINKNINFYILEQNTPGQTITIK